MYIIDKSNTKEHEYPTYGRQFKTYKWFKPIITGAIMGAIYFVLMVLLMFALVGGRGEGNLTYLDLNFDDLRMTTFILGTMVMAIPALFIATKIVRDRPFSSYTSARGGWNMKVFLVGLIVAAVVALLPRLIIAMQSTGLQPVNKVTALTLFIVVVIGGLQCIAEEYLFRGVFMQTLGSWFRYPIIAIILQAVVFTVGHSYDIYGMLSVFIGGIGFGIAAWITRGIEVTSALHIMENVPIFYLIGAGLTNVSGSANAATVIFQFCTYAVFILIILIIKKKTNLFDTVKKDDAAKWNKN